VTCGVRTSTASRTREADTANVRIEPTGEIVYEALPTLNGAYRGARSHRLAGISTLAVVWICKHRHATATEARACAIEGD
jgi:hypothetical protein